MKSWKIGTILGVLWSLLSILQGSLISKNPLEYNIYEIIAFFPYWFEMKVFEIPLFGVWNYTTLIVLLFILLIGAFIGTLVGYIVEKFELTKKERLLQIKRLIVEIYDTLPQSFANAALGLTFTILLALYLLRPQISAINMRYFLSAGVQSLAAILAIVVTLSLVAVQITSQNYSPRIFKIFTRDKRFWRLLLLYISSMLFLSLF